MLFYPITAVINAILSLSLGVYIISKSRDKLNKRFFALTLCIFSWQTAYFIWQLSDNAVDALFWTRCLMAGVMFTSVTFWHFVLTFLGIVKQINVGKDEFLISSIFSEISLLLN